MSNILDNDVADNEDATLYPEYKAGVYIWKIIPPILILFGTVGNILSIVVLTRKSIRTSTTALYLTVLAFSDIVVLYSGLLRQWLIYLFEEDVRHVSPAGCKINIWLVYSSLDFSAWIIIAVTIERVVSAWFPYNARSVCTKKSATTLIISIGLFVLGLNSHLLYGMGFTETRDEFGNVIAVKKCSEIDKTYSDFFNHTWPWVDLCAFCLIPFMVIVIGNALILFKVIQSQKKVNSRIVSSASGNEVRHVQSNTHGKQSSMTAILFTLNIVFLFSTSPVSIYNIGYAHWVKDANVLQVAQLDLWWAVVNMLMYANNSLNFLLYCLSGTKFRKEVVHIFCNNRSARIDYVRLKMSVTTRTSLDVTAKVFSPIVTITQNGGQSTSGYSGNAHSRAALKLKNTSNVSNYNDEQELCLMSVS